MGLRDEMLDAVPWTLDHVDASMHPVVDCGLYQRMDNNFSLRVSVRERLP